MSITLDNFFRRNENKEIYVPQLLVILQKTSNHIIVMFKDKIIPFSSYEELIKHPKLNPKYTLIYSSSNEYSVFKSRELVCTQGEDHTDPIAYIVHKGCIERFDKECFNR